MEMTVTAKCPECKCDNLVSVTDKRLCGMGFYEDMSEVESKDAKPPVFTAVWCIPDQSPVVTACDNCGIEFVVDVELEAHVTTRKIETEEGGK